MFDLRFFFLFLYHLMISFGVILWQILTNRIPWTYIAPHQLSSAVGFGLYLYFFFFYFGSHNYLIRFVQGITICTQNLFGLCVDLRYSSQLGEQRLQIPHGDMCHHPSLARSFCNLIDSCFSDTNRPSFQDVSQVVKANI